jgi:hypothetical protein
MSRIKFAVLFLILAMTLLWPAPVAAQDPYTCLPACFAYNKARPGGNGTQNTPWIWDGSDTLVSLVRDAVKDRLNKGTLELVSCTDEQPMSCTATLYTFYRDGTEDSKVLEDVPVPETGVALPFPYLLGGGTLLGVMLVATGIVLWRKA